MILVGNVWEADKSRLHKAYACVTNWIASEEERRKYRLGWIEPLHCLAPNPRLQEWKFQQDQASRMNQKLFETEFVPAFLRQIHADPTARQWLDRCERADRAGQKIALLCICENECFCHRSILAGILQYRGARVSLASGRDFSHYGRAYHALNANS